MREGVREGVSEGGKEDEKGKTKEVKVKRRLGEGKTNETRKRGGIGGYLGWKRGRIEGEKEGRVKGESKIMESVKRRDRKSNPIKICLFSSFILRLVYSVFLSSLLHSSNYQTASFS